MSEWKKVKLGEISLNIQTGPFGSQLHQSDYVDTGVPVIMPKDIINGKICDDTIARISSDLSCKLLKYQVEFEDIIYPRRGDISKCAIVDKNQKGWFCGTGCLKISIDKSLAKSKFIYYELQLPKQIGWIINHAIGATMLNLNTNILQNVPIDLPSINTQNRIAEILSRYDSLIENYQKQIKLLEESAQRLYKEWFVDLRFPGYENTKIVDGVPEGWSLSCLNSIASDSGIKENKGNFTQYKYYLPLDCLPSKSIAYLETKSINLAESSLIGFHKNDILFGALRPYFHKVVIARHSGITRSTCFVLNTKKTEYWTYLVMLLYSKQTIDYATQNAIGTTMPYIRLRDFMQMKILIPDSTILHMFTNKIEHTLHSIKVNAELIIKLTEARDRLLPKLMSGEIEV